MANALLREIRLKHREEHAALDRAVQHLSSAAEDPDRGALPAAWSTLEGLLLEHLELEETQLFPLLAGTHPSEMQQLLHEHERLRHLVSELGVACDLHTLRRRGVQELVQALEEHAAREDANLYRWLDEAAPLETRRHLVNLFVEMVRAELHPGRAKRPPPHAA